MFCPIGFSIPDSRSTRNNFHSLLPALRSLFENRYVLLLFYTRSYDVRACTTLHPDVLCISTTFVVLVAAVVFRHRSLRDARDYTPADVWHFPITLTKTTRFVDDPSISTRLSFFFFSILFPDRTGDAFPGGVACRAFFDTKCKRRGCPVAPYTTIHKYRSRCASRLHGGVSYLALTAGVLPGESLVYSRPENDTVRYALHSLSGIEIFFLFQFSIDFLPPLPLREIIRRFLFRFLGNYFSIRHRERRSAFSELPLRFTPHRADTVSSVQILRFVRGLGRFLNFEAFMFVE